jgi:hypothetical protein
MLRELLEAGVALAGERCFASASLQPPAAAFDAVPDTEDVRRRTSLLEPKKRTNR